MSKRAVLKITDDQFQQLAPLFLALQPRASIIAQIYVDGIRCKVLTPEEAIAIGAQLGADGRLSGSAFEAEAMVLRLESDLANKERSNG